MLEYNHRVTVKITSVHQSQRGVFLYDKNPTDVTVEEALFRRVRVRIGIRESMV